MTEAVIGLELPAPEFPEPRRAWRRLAGSLVAGIAFGLMVGLAALAVLATQFLGFRRLTVSSDSMSPALSTGDVIFVKSASVASVEVGDVVLFESGKSPCAASKSPPPRGVKNEPDPFALNTLTSPSSVSDICV